MPFAKRRMPAIPCLIAALLFIVSGANCLHEPPGIGGQDESSKYQELLERYKEAEHVGDHTQSDRLRGEIGELGERILDSLKPGVSTKNDVVAALGEPLMEVDGEQPIVRLYYYGPQTSQVLVVEVTDDVLVGYGIGLWHDMEGGK